MQLQSTRGKFWFISHAKQRNAAATPSILLIFTPLSCGACFRRDISAPAVAPAPALNVAAASETTEAALGEHVDEVDHAGNEAGAEDAREATGAEAGEGSEEDDNGEDDMGIDASLVELLVGMGIEK